MSEASFGFGKAWQKEWFAEFNGDAFWEAGALPELVPGVEFVTLESHTADGVTVRLSGEDKEAVRNLAGRLEVEL